jgi:hypothetical protein
MEEIPNNSEQEKLLLYKEKFTNIVSLDTLDHDKLEKLMIDVEAKASLLKVKYGNQIYENAWYHMLASSSPAPGRDISYEDFPGEDSIADFIDGLQV